MISSLLEEIDALRHELSQENTETEQHNFFKFTFLKSRFKKIKKELD